MDQNLCAQGELPRFVRNFYDDCRGPPRLFLLDKYEAFFKFENQYLSPVLHSFVLFYRKIEVEDTDCVTLSIQPKYMSVPSSGNHVLELTSEIILGTTKAMLASDQLFCHSMSWIISFKVRGCRPLLK